MKSQIINLSSIIIPKSGITPKVATDIKKLLATQALVNSIVELVKDELSGFMENQNVTLIEYDDLKISQSITGRRFAFDPAKQVDPKFTQTVSYQQVNSSMVDSYLELRKNTPGNTRKCPKTKYKDRTY